MSQISQAKIKFVQSLKRKKYRKKEGVFVIEGLKSCLTLLENHAEAVFLIVKDGLQLDLDAIQIFNADDRIMKDISSLMTVPDALGVFKLPPERKLEEIPTASDLIIFLDRIQDPGNLGTMIRTSDWYGVKDIILSPGCVDPYNPKALQSSMGSINQVRLYHADFMEIHKYLVNHEFVALDMGGVAIGDFIASNKPLVLIVGNEGQGISDEIKANIHHSVRIPGHDSKSAESLNAAISLAIGLDRLILR